MEEKVCRDGSDIIWLVVWNLFYFPYIGNNNPNWLSYFSEGLKPSTTFVLPCSFFFASPNEKNKTVLNGVKSATRSIMGWYSQSFAVHIHRYTRILSNLCFLEMGWFTPYPSISLHPAFQFNTSPGDDCLQATWPFGEASRIEMQEALSRKLMKNQAKRAAESEGGTCVLLERNGTVRSQSPVSLGTLPSQSAEGCGVWLTVVYEIYLSVTLV